MPGDSLNNMGDTNDHARNQRRKTQLRKTSLQREPRRARPSDQTMDLIMMQQDTPIPGTINPTMLQEDLLMGNTEAWETSSSEKLSSEMADILSDGTASAVTDGSWMRVDKRSYSNGSDQASAEGSEAYLSTPSEPEGPWYHGSEFAVDLDESSRGLQDPTFYLSTLSTPIGKFYHPVSVPV
jgi:hypothetical protein